MTAGQDITIAVVTHGDGGVFWSVFKKGRSAGRQGPGHHGQLPGIQQQRYQAVRHDQPGRRRRCSGPRRFVGRPGCREGCRQGRRSAGLPVVTTNSGSNLYKEFGAFTHIGQDEFTAGAGAGEKFNEAGVKVLQCIKQEQTNTGLDARCDGAKSTFKGKFLTPITTSGDASGKQQADIKAALDADPTIDGVFGTGPVVGHDASAAAKELGRTVTIGAVDLSSDILDDIAAGDVLFTIDQQQYLQGYVSVLALYLNVTNKNTLGGGLPINTGPGFVDKSNAAAVKELVAKGTR